MGTTRHLIFYLVFTRAT